MKSVMIHFNNSACHKMNSDNSGFINNRLHKNLRFSGRQFEYHFLQLKNLPKNKGEDKTSCNF
jgi:hypothetical protein